MIAMPAAACYQSRHQRLGLQANPHEKCRSRNGIRRGQVQGPVGDSHHQEPCCSVACILPITKKGPTHSPLSSTATRTQKKAPQARRSSEMDGSFRSQPAYTHAHGSITGWVTCGVLLDLFCQTCDLHTFCPVKPGWWARWAPNWPRPVQRMTRYFLPAITSGGL